MSERRYRACHVGARGLAELAQTPLGPPLHLRAVVDATGRRASVVVDGVELTGRGRTAATSVEALADRVRELSLRRHCRVFVVVDGSSRLEGFVTTPTRG